MSVGESRNNAPLSKGYMMKKNVLIVVFALLFILSLCGCSEKYSIGSKRPAGGYVFYDCDADNELGNADGLISTECGWRYLEAAPADLRVEYMFGYYIENGWVLSVGTDTAIGSGKTNTDALSSVMGETAYHGKRRTDKEVHAAKACADYLFNDYEDWFLPSEDELEFMYINLHRNGIGRLPVKALIGQVLRMAMRMRGSRILRMVTTIGMVKNFMNLCDQ